MVGFGPADLGSNPSRATSNSLALRNASTGSLSPSLAQNVTQNCPTSTLEQVDESPPLGMAVESYEHRKNCRFRSRTNGKWNHASCCLRWLQCHDD